MVSIGGGGKKPRQVYAWLRFKNVIYVCFYFMVFAISNPRTRGIFARFLGPVPVMTPGGREGDVALPVDLDGPLVAPSTPEELAIHHRMDDPMPSIPVFPPGAPKILVVYSGPSTLSVGNPHKITMYRRNFEFFLKHGIDCLRQDTIVVLGHEVAPIYRDELTAMDHDCQKEHSHRIKLVERENECLDMESVRLVVHGNVTDILAYDYFLYLNCGITGPMMRRNETNVPWTSKFIEKLVGNVRMVGLSHYCQQQHTHVQSMAYCLDRVAMKLVKESDHVYDCRPDKHKMSEKEYTDKIIDRYERGMCRLLLSNGHAITSLTRPKVLTRENRNNCTDKDLWLTKHLNETYGKIPTLEEVMFFKTSRLLTEEIIELINFTGTITWNW